METLLQSHNVYREVQLYEILKHSTKEERDLLCKQGKFKALCMLLKFDRHKWKNPDSAFEAMGSITFKMILEHFGDIGAALDFIQGVKPGFIYTQEFQKYVDGYLEIVNGQSQYGMKYKEYKLGNKSYRINYSSKRYVNGIFSEEWYIDDKLSRKDRPASIIYTQDGKVLEVTWFKNGKVHREDGPANIRYFNYGKENTEESWYINGEISRENGPAFVMYNSNGKVFLEKWYKNGKVHREDGPASIFYDDDGIPINHEWWTDGKKIA